MTADILGSMTAPPGPDPASDWKPCRIATLPPHLAIPAAEYAGQVRPSNRPDLAMAVLTGHPPLPPLHAAALTTRLWPNGTVLTVGFLDNPDVTTRRKILENANAWYDRGVNIRFAESNTDPVIRVARTPGQGYWSYVGTDCASVPAGEPTMNLDSFTANTADSEYIRVGRHEPGHALGGIHEHQRQEIIDQLDYEATIAVYMQWQGWSRQMVIQQVLTATPRNLLTESDLADVLSVLCYPFTGACTKNRLPIPGGVDIDATDIAVFSRIYPMGGPTAPPVTPPPAPATPGRVDVSGWIGIKGDAIRGLIGAKGQQPYDFQVACRSAIPMPPQPPGESFYAIAGQAQPNAASDSAVTVDPDDGDGGDEEDGP